MNISKETIAAPKKSLGYELNLTTARVRPVTGREWVYTATDEQMRVLYDIERLWAGLEGERFYYVFREVHDENGFDGWTVLLHDKTTNKTSWKRFEGFPPSMAFVFDVICLLVRQHAEREDGQK